MAELDSSTPNGSYTCHYVISRSHVAVCSTFSALMALIAIIGNSLVLFAIIKTPRLRFVTSYFIASLAIGDLYMNTVLVPLWVVKLELNIWTMDRHPLALAIEFLSIQMASSVAYNLCVVSIDRFISIKYIYEYSQTLTSRRAFVIIIAVWTFSLISSLPRLFLHDIKDISKLFVILAIVIIFLPYGVIIYCYIRIYKIARTHANQIATNDRRQSFATIETERNKKAAITIGLVIGIYTILGIPVLVVAVADSIVTSLDPCKAVRLRVFWMWALALSYSHSAYNPWIYAARNKLYNRAIKGMLGLKPNRLFAVENTASVNQTSMKKGKKESIQTPMKMVMEEKEQEPTTIENRTEESLAQSTVNSTIAEVQIKDLSSSFQV